MKDKNLYFSALALSTLFAFTACAAESGQVAEPSSSVHDSGHHASSAPATESGAANSADMSFASGMKAHHQQALDMSEDLLSKEDIPQEVRELAEKIKSAQGPEIELMNSWLADWKMPQGMDHGQMNHGDGMISDEDIAALKKAEGTSAAKLFLQQMITHHEGAVDMAMTEVVQGSDAEAIKLSKNIIEDQNREIQEMKELLSGL